MNDVQLIAINWGFTTLALFGNHNYLFVVLGKTREIFERKVFTNQNHK